MRRLILIRHGKALPPPDRGHDFERPLSRAGEHEAAVVGGRLAGSDWVPELIVTSTAPRALATAAAVARQLGDPPLLAIQELYLAEPATLRQVLARYASERRSVALVAHNPGLTQLVRELSDAHVDELPTAGVVGIAFDGQGWDALSGGRLGYFDAPLRARPLVRDPR